MFTANRLAGFLFLLVFICAGVLIWRGWHGRVPPGCVEVARLFGQPICAADLGTAEQYNPPPPNAHGSAEDKERQQAADNLRNVIWDRALVHKFGRAAITPAPADVEKIRGALNNHLQNTYVLDQQIEAMIKGLLNSNVYSLAMQDRLRKVLQTIDLTMHLYEARQQQQTARPEQLRFVQDAAELKIARHIADTWQADRALYFGYGGRILPENGDFEPVDAYGKFIAYIQQDGGLVITDRRLQDALQPIEQLVAHEVHARDYGVYTKSYFDDPVLRYTYLSPTNRLDALRRGLNNLPTLGPIKDSNDPTGKTSLPTLPP